MAGEIRVDLVADATKFESAMRRANATTDKFAASQRDLTESLDDGERRIIGTADLLDGLAETMGLPFQGSVQMARGFADIASGMKDAVIPAVEQTIVKMKALAASMSAVPYGRFALGAGLAAAAVIGVTASTDRGRDALGRLADVVKGHVNRQLELMGNAAKFADDRTGGFGSRLLNLIPGFRRVDEAAQESAARLAMWAAQAQAASRAIALANQFGGTVDDPDGAFASQAWIEANTGQAAIVAAMDKVSSASSKVSKALKAGIDKQAKAAQDAFQAQLPKLQAAAQKFTDAVSLKDALGKNFGLNFGEDLGHDVTEGLRRQVDRFRQFVAKLASLRKAGLPESLARAFADAGPAALDEMNRINSGNIAEIKKLARQAERTMESFSTDETKRRTGVDPNKPVKVVIDVRGGDSDLKNLIKKWVRTDGGGSVQVAFR